MEKAHISVSFLILQAEHKINYQHADSQFKKTYIYQLIGSISSV